MAQAKEIQIQSKVCLSNEATDLLCGKSLTRSDFDVLIENDADVYRPDGTLLFKYRRNVIPLKEVEVAYPIFAKIRSDVKNRHTAALGLSMRPTLRDGTRSKTVMIKAVAFPHLKDVSSAIIGYFDRYARFPYCRETAWNIQNRGPFQKLRPTIQRIADSFAELVPERFNAQMAMVKRTKPDWVISGSPFTTITVNKNFRTLVHQDAGDLKEGFGVMAAMRRGPFRGGYTVFPKYRVAVDLQTGGVVFADVHEWHGNTLFESLPGVADRVALIFYYREKMKNCGTAEEEFKRARGVIKR